jgi:hypothetical protein
MAGNMQKSQVKIVSLQDFKENHQSIINKQQ